MCTRAVMFTTIEGRCGRCALLLLCLLLLRENVVNVPQLHCVELGDYAAIANDVFWTARLIQAVLCMCCAVLCRSLCSYAMLCWYGTKLR